MLRRMPVDELVEVIQGEALEALWELDPESVDGIVTDPPYSSGGLHRGDRALSPLRKYVHSGTMVERPDFAGDHRDQRSFLTWATLWLTAAFRVTKPGGVCVLFSDWRQLPVASDALQAGGWTWRGTAVWDKGGGARPAMGRFKQQAEFMLWGSRGPLDERRHVGCLPGVFTIPVKGKAKAHVTAKPLELMAHVLELVEPGGLVVDPFAGSGTTLRAARASGRRSIGIEVEPAYVRIMLDLLSQARLPLEPAEEAAG